MKKKVLVILGPTASGKSNLAVKLAKKFDGEIISADSRQVYKSLDVGTGKITKQEMKGIPHHLLDVANPKKQFSVAQYKKLAERKVRNIIQRGKLPIIAGGAGFYIDALTGVANFPDVGPNKRLREKLSQKSADELFKMLRKKDPERAGVIEPKNKVRLIRALEIVETIGKVPLCQPATSTQYKFIFIGLKPDDLDNRIYKRLNDWLRNGLIREVKNLHNGGLSWKRINEIGLVYKSVAKYLQKTISKEKTIEEIFTEIKHYSKRQMTWFKRNKKIKWFKPEEYKKIESYLARNLRIYE